MSRSIYCADCGDKHAIGGCPKTWTRICEKCSCVTQAGPCVFCDPKTVVKASAPVPKRPTPRTVGALISLLEEHDPSEIIGYTQHPGDDFVYLSICPGNITKTLPVARLFDITTVWKEPGTEES